MQAAPGASVVRRAPVRRAQVAGVRRLPLRAGRGAVLRAMRAGHMRVHWRRRLRVPVHGCSGVRTGVQPARRARPLALQRPLPLVPLFQRSLRSPT